MSLQGEHAVAAITNGVEFIDAAIKRNLQFNTHLGFLVLNDPVPDLGEVTIVGFTPMPPDDLFSQRYSVTNLSQLAPEEQGLEFTGKGIGIRLYDSAQAHAGYPQKLDTLALSAVTLRWGNIEDHRQQTDHSTTGKGKRIARHGGRLLMAAGDDIETVVNAVHAGYKETSQGILFNQPPRAALRARVQRGVWRQPVQPEFMIIRDSTIPIRGIGARRAPGWFRK